MTNSVLVRARALRKEYGRGDGLVRAVITALLGTLVAVAGLTAVPARLAARLPIAETLHGDGT